MIVFEHVQKTYPNGTRVLQDVSATVNRGDVIAVIGPSGTGKSTLLRCVNLLDPPTGGKIILDGEEITRKGYPMDKVHQKVCMVFQSFNLFEHLSVLENVMFPQIMVAKKSRQEAYDEALRLLSSVGMAKKIDSYPKALSGGQKQRVAIARTLAMHPQVILFDEPTSALDPSSVDEVKNVIRKVAQSDVTCMIVTHDMEFARQISNRVFYLDQGIIYEEGPSEEIFERPKKERTIAFFRKYQTVEEEITERNFDYPLWMAKLHEYGVGNQLSEDAIRSVQLMSEELIYSILLKRLRDPFRIRVTHEYDKKERQMKITAEYSGGRNNILATSNSEKEEKMDADLEQIQTVVQILLSKLDDFEYRYQEERSCPNTIIMKLKKDN